MAAAEVKIRPMEPEDTHGILEVDRKINGVQRPSLIGTKKIYPFL